MRRSSEGTQVHFVTNARSSTQETLIDANSESCRKKGGISCGVPQTKKKSTEWRRERVG